MTFFKIEKSIFSSDKDFDKFFTAIVESPMKKISWAAIFLQTMGLNMNYIFLLPLERNSGVLKSSVVLN